MDRPKYFLYARKSSEDDDRQVMSIEAQLFELREFARRENLEILVEFQESKSAKTPGREVFNEMMMRVENGEANGMASRPPRSQFDRRWAHHLRGRHFAHSILALSNLLV